MHIEYLILDIIVIFNSNGGDVVVLVVKKFNHY